MEKYEIELYEKEDGSCPVAEFLDELEPKMWAKVTRNIDVLSEHNLNLREPLVKPVENGIFELRTQSGNNIARVFYFFFVGKKIILTNGFIKKTQKMPRKYIELALAYKVDYVQRGEKNEMGRLQTEEVRES